LRKTLRGSLAAYILHPKNLSRLQRFRIVEEATEYSGSTYGWGKLPLHLMDSIFSRKKQWWTRTLSISNMSICSWLVAVCYKRVGKDFGEPVASVTPEDIFKFAKTHPDKYLIRKLQV